MKISITLTYGEAKILVGRIPNKGESIRVPGSRMWVEHGEQLMLHCTCEDTQEVARTIRETQKKVKKLKHERGEAA